MNSKRAQRNTECKRGHAINSGDLYYPQRRGKKLCFECGRKVSENKSFISKVMEWLK
jgi:hypothetical protein